MIRASSSRPVLLCYASFFFFFASRICCANQFCLNLSLSLISFLLFPRWHSRPAASEGIPHLVNLATLARMSRMDEYKMQKRNVYCRLLLYVIRFIHKEKKKKRNEKKKKREKKKKKGKKKKGKNTLIVT